MWLRVLPRNSHGSAQNRTLPDGKHKICATTKCCGEETGGKQYPGLGKKIIWWQFPCMKSGLHKSWWMCRAEGTKQCKVWGGKRLIFLHIAQHVIFVLCALTQISCQWDRREAETSKERLSSWYLKPIQKHQKSLIKAWLLCVLLSPFAYWEFYFVSFSFCDSNLFTSSSSLLLTVSLYAWISHILALCMKGNCIGLI